MTASALDLTAPRVRAIWIVGAASAAFLGVFAALGSPTWAVTLTILLTLTLIAFALPLAPLGILIAALIPFQIYFPLGDSAFHLRAAFVLTLVACARLLFTNYRLLFNRLFLPAFAFLAVALASALLADSRALALRGVYDWLAVFAAAFFFRAIPRARGALIAALFAGGIAQAALGWIQIAAGRDAVLEWLSQPASAIFFPPNLLRERLSDLGFNWLTFERVTAFGTFTNAIDYAILLAAMVCLLIPFLFAWHARKIFAAQFIAAILIAGALIGSAKGSGALAFAGGGAALAFLLAPRVSPRARWLALGTGALILLFTFGMWSERGLFLLQREQGEFGTSGRLNIWIQLADEFLRRPFFGYGLNHAATLIPATRTLSAGAITFIATPPESAYVAALIETGALGFGALMLWLAIALRRAGRAARIFGDPARVGIFAALVAILFGNLTVTGLTTDQNGMLLGALIGMTFAEWDIE